MVASHDRGDTSVTFISYAQNREDVMLFRALKSVDCGFYIDVGANDPVYDSVTKVFYDRGWHGINIEPVQNWFERLVQERPRDINLQVAVANEGERLRLFDVVGTGMATSVETFAKWPQEHGFEVMEYDVPCQTLAQICKAHSVQEVHFLKIDVEGAEASVLDSLDYNLIRPWIIVVESTEPNSTVETYQQWEPDLIENGYELAYFDGLNRFYVAREHCELRDAFKVPPNFFDHFLPSAQWEAQALAEARWKELQEAQALAEARWKELQEAQALAEARWKELQEAQAQLQAVYATRSWRLTAVLREAYSRLQCLHVWYANRSRRLTDPLWHVMTLWIRPFMRIPHSDPVPLQTGVFRTIHGIRTHTKRLTRIVYTSSSGPSESSGVSEIVNPFPAIDRDALLARLRKHR